MGSLYFKFASKLATIFFDEIITDSIEMSKVYNKKFCKKSNVIAYGSTMSQINDLDILEKFFFKKK